MSDSSGVEILIGVRMGSLVFIRSSPGFEATVETELRAYRYGSPVPVVEEFRTDRIQALSYEETRASTKHTISRFMRLPPGEFRIELTLRDRTSGKEISRYRSIKVPDLAETGVIASGLRLFQGTSREDGEQVLGPYAVASKGILFCSYQVKRRTEKDSVVAEAMVVRIGWDTTIAASPYSFNSLRGSLEYTGLDIDEADTIATFELSAYTSTVSWEMTLNQPGVYLIVSRNKIFGDGEIPTEVEVRRPLVMMPAGFPRPSVTGELVGPVQYLLRENEKGLFHSLQTNEERRSWLADFWRAVSDNERVAESLVDRFYSRVEEANEYFSSFKPGWQTDRGMIYLILGPPLDIRQRLNGEYWIYSRSDEDPLSTFEFRRVPLPDELNSFDHYVLERQPYYDDMWIHAIDRWRSGTGF